MGIIVQKFGGTSVGSVERIQHVAQLIKREVDQGNQIVAVVSAMGKSTDHLLDLAKSISKNPAPREYDMLLTTGEQVSIALLSMALQEIGIAAESLTGWQAGIQTEAVHSKARIQHIHAEGLHNRLREGKVLVVAGFQGISKNQEITTLGRGGSDTTAVALAAALGAERCDIFTDVTGVYTADPRVVPAAQQLQQISYDEMLELANLGAGVLHPRAVECAKNNAVVLTVRSSFENVAGTIVKEEYEMEDGLVVHGVAHEENVTKVTIRGIKKRLGSLARVFKTLAEAQINVDIIINQSMADTDSTNISFSIDEGDLEKTIAILNQNRELLMFDDILAESNLAKVSIVGAGMISNPGVAAEMFDCLSQEEIAIKMVSTSEIKVSCVIDQAQMLQAVRVLHHTFGLDK